MEGVEILSWEQLMADAEATYDPQNPPNRPVRPFTLKQAKERDVFFCDLENAVLRDFHGDTPTGPQRYLNPDWAALMKKNLYPFHSDADWSEYIEFCENGGGDDHFYDLSADYSDGE